MSKRGQLTLKTKILKKILRWLMVIKKSYKPERMLLFGSFARGDVRKGSDIDIILIKQTPKRFLDRIKDVLDVYKGDIAIEPVVYTPKEFAEIKNRPFIKDAIKESIEI